LYKFISYRKTRAVASSAQPEGGEKKFRWGQLYTVSLFLKFEVKNRRKSVEEAKA